MRKFYAISVLIIISMFCLTGRLMAQIGGQFTPLQHSEHTYMIKMSDASYIPVWGVYIANTSESEIENDLATAATGFQFLDSWENGGIAYYKIQFAIGLVGMTVGDYVIGYKETTNDTKLCTRAVIQDIQLYDAFDVDVVLNNPGDDATRCPEGSEAWKESDISSTTTIQYVVFMNNPVEPPGYIATGGNENWSFKFKIETSGIGGNDATISGVTVAAEAPDVLTSIPTFTVPAGISTYEMPFSVSPSSVTPLIFTVVYNDVLGVSQNISFSINTILGAYDDPDIDEVNGTQANNNIVTHTLYALPNVSEITAWGP